MLDVEYRPAMSMLLAPARRNWVTATTRPASVRLSVHAGTGIDTLEMLRRHPLLSGRRIEPLTGRMPSDGKDGTIELGSPN